MVGRLTDDKKEKIYFGEQISLIGFCSPQKGLIVLVWFINGRTQKRFQKQNLQFGNTVFLKMLFLQGKTFEWHIYKWGYGGLISKTKNHFWSSFFRHRKQRSWEKNIEWFGKKYLGGYTGKMIKNKCFRKKVLWETKFVKDFLNEIFISRGRGDWS